MNWRLLLWPFSLIYGALTGLRNQAFDKRLIKQERFALPVVAVGNLSTGGTGKTPAVEFILRKLPEYRWGVVSRGYGRNTKGLLIPDEATTARAMGDEPYQVFHKFPGVAMALSEKRSTGIAALLERKELDAIVLDDAYQHRHVAASHYLLLTSYGQPFFRDHLLPAGDLRESKAGRKRAQTIVVTKCPPELSVGEASDLRERLRADARQEVYFSSQGYEAAVNFKREPLPNGSAVHLLSGIAHPQYFEAECKRHFKVEQATRFPDHHDFSTRDLERITRVIDQGGRILTTEKDWVRLKGRLNDQRWAAVYYLPLTMEILFGEEEKLLRSLRQHIREFPPLEAGTTSASSDV